MKIILAIVILVTLAYSASWSFATSSSQAAVRKDRSSLPITIKSNEMSADNKGKTAVFIGKVVAKQGDVTIYADKATIYYGVQKGEVDKVEVDGNVRIIKDNSTGIAAHAVYESKLGRITLTGNPRVTQGKDTLSGETITYFIDEDRSVVTGGASVIIQPPARKSNETLH